MVKKLWLDKVPEKIKDNEDLIFDISLLKKESEIEYFQITV